MIFVASGIRKSVPVKIFFAKFFLHLAKSSFLNLVKFDFLNLTYFATVDKFSKLSPILPSSVSLLVPFDIL